MSKPLIQAPTNAKNSLNVQEVKIFLNLWLIRNIIDTKLIVSPLLNSTWFNYKGTGSMFRSFAAINFFNEQKGERPGIPGRPVISSVRCHSPKISKYVDYHLQPIVWEISSYIKDTSNFLRKLKPITEVPENH